MPVESVTWDEAVAFCKKLTEKEADKPYARRGWAYRLPTEAEWEYACRAGTDTPVAFGEKLMKGRQGVFTFTEDDPIAEGAALGPAPQFGKRVGALEQPDLGGERREPNRFGLYELHGNVAEWCSDYFQRGYPGDGPRTDPTGPAGGNQRVVRGGSWADPASACRSAARRGASAGSRLKEVGFRVVYAPVKAEK